MRAAGPCACACACLHLSLRLSRAPAPATFPCALGSDENVQRARRGSEAMVSAACTPRAAPAGTGGGGRRQGLAPRGPPLRPASSLPPFVLTVREGSGDRECRRPACADSSSTRRPAGVSLGRSPGGAQGSLRGEPGLAPPCSVCPLHRPGATRGCGGAGDLLPLPPLSRLSPPVADSRGAARGSGRTWDSGPQCGSQLLPRSVRVSTDKPLTPLNLDVFSVKQG